MRSALLVLFALLALSPSSRAAIIYVNQSAPGPTHDGTSWQTAFLKLQDAVNAAAPGDQVWVAGGTYKESITMKTGVALYGGFLGTETSLEQRGLVAITTTLDGQNQGTVVTIPADATSGTILDGFTIQRGYGPVGDDGQGKAGGIYIKGGNPVVSHNVITGCIAEGGRTTVGTGGGVYVAKGGVPLIVGNTITGNYAMFGGGICAFGGLIRDNVIAYNAASHPILQYGAGGGVCAWGPKVVVAHNLFQGNQAPDSNGGGGGLDANVSAVMDNVFRDNEGQYATAMQSTVLGTVIRNAFTDGDGPRVFNEVSFDGGVFADNLITTNRGTVALVLGANAEGNADGTEPIIVNNTFVHEGPNSTYYAIRCYYGKGERPVFSNNIVMGWSKTAAYGPGGIQPTFTADYNAVYGNGDNTLTLPGASPIGTSGNISQDPLFTDPANGDYTLKAGSPCIDAGNDVYVNPGDRNLASGPRIYGAHVDIGAYEYGSPLYTLQDAAEVLKIAAGLSLAAPAEATRLDAVPGGGLTATDATRIAQWLLN